jgi:RNA polymerase sigma-70 factor (ECF subfamily)
MENFNQIYSDNHKMVLNFISMKINDSLIAEELTNDVFMRVHKHLNNFDEEKSSMKTWVMNIASNIVIDHYRKSKMNTISIENEMNSKHTYGDNSGTYVSNAWEMSRTQSTPISVMINSELGDRLRNEISSLDETHREIADLYFNGQLTYEEIGQRLNQPLGTVKGKISRARKKLQERLETVKV